MTSRLLYQQTTDIATFVNTKITDRDLPIALSSITDIIYNVSDAISKGKQRFYVNLLTLKTTLFVTQFRTLQDISMGN